MRLELGEGWKRFDFAGPNEYVDSVLEELKDKLRPHLLVEPRFEWDWTALPFEIGRSVQADEPPFKIFLNPQMAEFWEKDKQNAAKILCHAVAHEFYHIYAGIAEKAWYDEGAANRFAGKFCGVPIEEHRRIEEIVLKPTEAERKYWKRWVEEPEVEMPEELENKYRELYEKWKGLRVV